MDNRRRARGDERRGREVERADVVERPARETEIHAGEAELDDVREVLPREVGVGQHDALRAARGARGVHQPVNIVAGHRQRGGDARRRPELDQRRPPFRCHRRDADADDIAVPCPSLLRSRDRRATRRHQRTRFRVVEDVAQLRRREPPVDRHRDHAEVVRGEDALEELGAVVREQADHVAGADPALVQPGRQRGGTRSPSRRR